MSSIVPLSGSTTGRPITVSNVAVTPIQTSLAGRTDSVRLSVINTTAGAITVTVDVAGVTAAFSLAANAIEHIRMSISNGDELGMQGSAVGLRVLGEADRSSLKAS